ncbi:tripartite tricarboxylate transporter TctB family protein [Caenimonas sedimenti]|uniref:tripartite tricarboxylate transporter TctB family protein n=1 Tax=Caenimonas sedimenti TaxID=2596921 RepID=UPI00164975CA|nr:tripartite tricarboxylate transporter TctB family protein [Caenimonas sedimenti]
MSEPGAPAGPRWQTQCGIGVALLLTAAALWFDIRNLPVSPAVGVGPSAALKLVGAIVAILGLCHFIGAWRARKVRHSQAVDHGNRASLAIVLAALVGQILLLEVGAGFIFSSLWLFALTARGFGERVGPKSVAIGATLAILVYLFFTKALSLALPAGPLERLFG